MQIYGKMAVLLLFAEFAISPFYLVFIYFLQISGTSVYISE